MRPQTALIIVIKGDGKNIFQYDDFFLSSCESGCDGIFLKLLNMIGIKMFVLHSVFKKMKLNFHN